MKPATRRFTACAVPALEERVLRDLSGCVDQLLAAMPRDAVAGIVLSGSYGRGEGGAWRRNDVLVPFDDYDIHVVAAALPRARVERHSLDIRTAAVSLSGRVGVRVMVSLLDRDALRRPQATRSMAVLHAGHRVLVGPPRLLASLPGPAPQALPAIEGTRLVLAGVSRVNRARASLERPQEPAVAARVARDVMNAWLAGGDGWLIANRRYHPSAQERLERLWREAPIAELRDGYVATVRSLLDGTATPEAAALPAAVEAVAAALNGALADVERVRVPAPTLDEPLPSLATATPRGNALPK